MPEPIVPARFIVIIVLSETGETASFVTVQHMALMTDDVYHQGQIFIGDVKIGDVVYHTTLTMVEK